jgi:hypothetical protein
MPFCCKAQPELWEKDSSTWEKIFTTEIHSASSPDACHWPGRFEVNPTLSDFTAR